MKRTLTILLALAAALPAPLLSAKTDDINIPFNDDPAVQGEWQSVAYARSMDDFDPDSGVQPKLFFAGIKLLPGGRTSDGNRTWTKDFIINPSMKTASRYTLKSLGGLEYMFMEWKSGDYILRDMAPGYYVMVRAGDLQKQKDRAALKIKELPPARDCLNPGLTPAICARPAPYIPEKRTLGALPSYDPASRKMWQLDLRGLDITALDLSGRTTDLRYADFDTLTRFPAKLPEGFDPAKVMALGRDPGLGVRALHAKGITGKGIGIGIIDQQLLTTHKEYAGALRSYEEMHVFAEENTASMHGGAVASIAAGRTCGAAPDADLYFIANDFMDADGSLNFKYLAAAIDRLIAISGALPREKRIRVISISRGFDTGDNGAEELMAAIARAGKEGMLVVTTSPDNYYKDFSFMGLGREPLADPDKPASYGPGIFWSAGFYSGNMELANTLLVPMDSRTTAGPSGDDQYVFYSNGGLSWATPYVAGLYALACQADPSVTPEAFLKKALAASRTLKLERGGKTLELKGIVDPAALLKK